MPSIPLSVQSAANRHLDNLSEIVFRPIAISSDKRIISSVDQRNIATTTQRQTKAKAKTMKTTTNTKKAKLLQRAIDLNIEGADVMNAKALKAAIASALESPPLPTAEEIAAILVAPAIEATQQPSAKPPVKPVRVPLTGDARIARLAKARQTMGQIAGAPATGSTWHSPAGQDHIVLGSWQDNGKTYFRTARLSDGREFTAQCKAVTRDFVRQIGVNVSTVAPSAPAIA